MSGPNYSVSLEKEQLVFSAAHFITFNGNICERLHGHNYRVKCQVDGPLDENRYVVDFIALRDRLMEVISQLDHRVLLPTEHAAIQVAQEGAEVIARFEEKRWVFPVDDCCLLPVVNTTAEELARYIGLQLKERMAHQPGLTLAKLKVFVDENHGQWASCEMDW